jgi:diadenosine tetraphosphate (Ap4A) HIT family hydrolase
MPSLRTPESQDHYLKLIDEGILNGSCVLCTKPAIKEFEYWKILPNDFPYDRIAKVHHMIVPKRHTTEPELTADEINELNKIKQEYLFHEYDYVMEAAHRKKSIPAHFHLHLIVVKD